MFLFSNITIDYSDRIWYNKSQILSGFIDFSGGRFMSTSLNQMFETYMLTKTEFRPSTASNYRYNYDRYVRKTLGIKPIGDIKYSDIIFLYNHMLHELNLSLGSVEFIQRVIYPVFEMAVRDDIIRKNPCSKVIQQVKKKAMDKEPQVRHALTIEEQRAFIKFIDDTSLYYRWRPLMVFMLGTGCRVGEVVGLRWQDVDMEKRQININHSLIYHPKRKEGEVSRWVLVDPKTESGTRIIPMVDAVYDALNEEKMRQQKEHIKCVTVVEDIKDFIFINARGEIHNPSGINREIKRMIAKHNELEAKIAEEENRKPILLPNFSCHYFRHTFCSRLCEADTPIKVIQAIMGHKDIKTTMDIYAEVSEKKKETTLNTVINELDLF